MSFLSHFERVRSHWKLKLSQFCPDMSHSVQPRGFICLYFHLDKWKYIQPRHCFPTKVHKQGRNQKFEIQFSLTSWIQWKSGRKILTIFIKTMCFRVHLSLVFSQVMSCHKICFHLNVEIQRRPICVDVSVNQTIYSITAVCIWENIERAECFSTLGGASVLFGVCQQTFIVWGACISEPWWTHGSLWMRFNVLRQYTVLYGHMKNKQVFSMYINWKSIHTVFEYLTQGCINILYTCLILAFPIHNLTNNQWQQDIE